MNTIICMLTSADRLTDSLRSCAVTSARLGYTFLAGQHDTEANR